MTRNQIVERLFVSSNFNDCISRMEPAHLRDDLKMEVIAIVLEWPEDKVVKLHTNGALEYYVVRVILNQVQSSTSPFYKKYRQTYSDVTEVKDDECDMADRETRESLEDLALGNINYLYWYDAEMLRTYMRLGNYRAIEKETGIPFSSCFKTIKKAVERLKCMAGVQPEPLFTKDELKQIQSPQIKLQL